MLRTALGVLERVHAVAFHYWGSPSLGPSISAIANPAEEVPMAAWDVRSVMAEEQRRVLGGTQLVFSRVIPLQQEPQSHPLWKLAEQCGALCSTVVSETTTHIVAATRGTEKVRRLHSRAADRAGAS